MKLPAATPFRAGNPPGPPAAPNGPGMAFSGPTVLLADCSEWQPDIADATYLQWSQAIVIRAAYGYAHADSAWYGGQRRAALHAGGARFTGIYQFLVAGQDGGAAAVAFHAIVGAIQPGEVFIADFEEGVKGELGAWYSEMLSLYGAGIAPYLWTYTGLYFGESTGVLPVQWIADYTSEPATPHTLWQFTDAYQVPGVGVCDCSVFHGTIGELAALTYQATPPPPPPRPISRGTISSLSGDTVFYLPNGAGAEVCIPIPVSVPSLTGPVAPASLRFSAPGAASVQYERGTDSGVWVPFNVDAARSPQGLDLAMAVPGQAAIRVQRVDSGPVLVICDFA